MDKKATIEAPVSDEEVEIVARYKMSVQTWRESLRTDIFHSLLPNNSVSLCIMMLTVPIGYLLVQLSGQDELLRTIILTLALSIIAGLLSAQLILVFKDKFADNNLFGKDLNKAGAKEDKPKV